MPKKLTTKEFIKRASEKHNNKYDYSLSIYENSETKLDIICPLHQVFSQNPNDHLQGRGCHECGGTKTLTLEIFINKSIENFG